MVKHKQLKMGNLGICEQAQVLMEIKEDKDKETCNCAVRRMQTQFPWNQYDIKYEIPINTDDTMIYINDRAVLEVIPAHDFKEMDRLVNLMREIGKELNICIKIRKIVQNKTKREERHGQ